MLTKVESLFLEAIKASLTDSEVTWDQEITKEEWKSLFHMAEEHHLMPMFFEAVYHCPAIATCEPMALAVGQQSTVRSVMRQMMKTSEFYDLYKVLVDGGVIPCVVKGIICRNLYVKPDYRCSGDEDIFVPEEQFPLCRDIMKSYGMVMADPGQNPDKDYEVPFGKPGRMILVEVHKHMFAPDEAAYCEFNRYFDDVHKRLLKVTIDGNELMTMPYTDHFLFLICHAYKHFVHGGFGIRQVCDVFKFAEAYGTEMDWDYLYEKCCEINAEVFAAAMLKIGEVYLTFDASKAGMPKQWMDLMKVDPTNMLKDLLAAGVFGTAEESRKQSSTVTVSALTAQKQGKQQKSGTVSALFPPRYTLTGRYPYLHKYPFLLPVAWVDRMVKFAVNRKSNNVDISKSLEIGNERINLMREYGIMK